MAFAIHGGFRLTAQLKICTSAMWGRSSREELTSVLASSGGLNYGWRVMEGSLCFDHSSGCDTSGRVFPGRRI
ncbi:MAG: hypothetical protein U0X92_11705 [Anaerolineales bacterium]